MNDAQKKKEEDEVLARLMGTKDGRSFVRRLIAQCRAFGSMLKRVHPEWSTDQELWFRAARQDFGVWLSSEAFRVNPVGYQQMDAEHYEARLRESVEKKPDGENEDA